MLQRLVWEVLVTACTAVLVTICLTLGTGGPKEGLHQWTQHGRMGSWRVRQEVQSVRVRLPHPLLLLHLLVLLLRQPVHRGIATARKVRLVGMLVAWRAWRLVFGDWGAL